MCLLFWLKEFKLNKLGKGVSGHKNQKYLNLQKVTTIRNH